MLEIGFGKATITPPLGTPLGGYENRTKNAIGIHDDAYARCMLFRDSNTDQYIALICCDLLWLNYVFSDRVKEIVEEITYGKLKRNNVVLHALHVHSSQRIEGGLEFYYKRIKKPHNFDKGWYVEYGVPYLQRAIASSVYGALLDLKPAFMNAYAGKTASGYNRRMKDPAAKVVDEDLLAMVCLHDPMKTSDGANIRAIFYNLANHCVVLGEQNYYISQDWPYWTAQELRAKYHLEWSAEIIFAQGTAGNINPFNCKFGEEVREMKEAEILGHKIAEELQNVLESKKDLIIADANKPTILEITTNIIKIEVTDKEKAEFYRQMKLDFIGIEHSDGKIYLVVRMHLIQINNLIIIAVPGEPFGEFGVEMKKIVKQFNAEFIPIVLELCDGAVGYITTRDSYYNGKGYEASLAGSAETGYLMLESLKTMVKKLKTE